MIPPIIHQTWKTLELRPDAEKWHKKIIGLHPGWDVKLWTDEDNLRLVKETFPHLTEMYQALEYNIMRADIIRYMYMYKFGGYYLDLDYELFQPFDQETSAVDLMLPVSTTEHGNIIIGNSIFGSVPGHPFWKDVLDDLHRFPPTKKFLNKFEVLKLTGPHFISKVYFTNPEKYKAYLVPKQVYHPANNLVNKRNYEQTLLQQGTRGIHHCQGSWLSENNSLYNIISRANSSVIRRLSNLFR